VEILLDFGPKVGREHTSKPTVGDEFK